LLIIHIDKQKKSLLNALAQIRKITDWKLKAYAYRQKIFTNMEKIRLYCDELERLMPKHLWPFPTYADILFN
jgi:glutamine synthetase